jgi:YcxB-like protein
VQTGVTARGLIDGRAYAAECAAYVWGKRGDREVDRASPTRHLAAGSQHFPRHDGDGVVDSDSITTSRYSWRAFSDVTEQAGLILLWIDRGAKCLIVPARALADDAARRDFVTLAREGIAQAAAA